MTRCKLNLETIREMLDAGYSSQAICCRLGCKAWHLSDVCVRYGIRAKADTDGYVTISEVARRLKIPREWIRVNIEQGSLRSVTIGHKRFTKMEWVDIWMNNGPYREAAEKARQMALKIGTKKPSSSPAKSGQ